MRQFTDDEQGDSTTHDVLAEHRRTLARGVRARAAYQYLDGEYVDFRGAARPRREHRIEAGPEIETVFSRRRRLALSLAGGASHIESIGSIAREPYRAWVPIGSASTTIGLSPLWSVEGGYRRGFSLLQGVTDHVYTTDTGFLRTGGLVGARTDLLVGATYGNWKTPVASGVDGRLNVYGGSLELRVALTATVAASAGYYYYHHRYSNPGQLPAGFPAEYDRHAVRVGLIVSVPLVGNPQQPLIPR